MKVWLLTLPLALNVAAIRVPVTKSQTITTTELSKENQHSNSQPQPATTDSYNARDDQPDLAPEDEDGVLVPVRYLLPPREDAPLFTYPPETQAQDDWTPMVEKIPEETRERLFSKTKDSEDPATPIVALPQQDLPEEIMKQWFDPELLESSQDESKPEKNDPGQEPSRYLLPPLEDSEPSLNFDMPVPSTELKPPSPHLYSVFRPVKNLKPIMPTIFVEMQPPPSPTPNKYKNPTALYPKKYSKYNAYKPIAIPMREYQDDVAEVPKAKPVKYVKPMIVEDEYLNSMENQKKLVKYQQQEDKERFQNEEDARRQQELLDSMVQEVFATPDTADDQKSSDSSYSNEEEGKVDPSERKSVRAEPSGPSERTEFRMHGLHGPNTYQFGYDTGKGKNRQFRYEERSNDGRVRGHYGYVDRGGKTQVVNYDAHPTLGFHAQPAMPA